jgi:hypothetical protein
MPTANDAEIEYPARMAGEELVFMTADHGEVRYRREK